MAATYGLYWGVPVAIVTCWMLQSEVCGFSQRKRPQFMGPKKEFSCSSSSKGMVVTYACSQLGGSCNLWDQDHTGGALSTASGTSPGFGSSEVLVPQSCLTVCDPNDWVSPCSSGHGIVQTRTLEWIAISFSRRFSQPRNWREVSCIAGRPFTIWDTRDVVVRSIPAALWKRPLSTSSQLPAPYLSPGSLLDPLPPAPSLYCRLALDSHFSQCHAPTLCWGGCLCAAFPGFCPLFLGQPVTSSCSSQLLVPASAWWRLVCCFLQLLVLSFWRPG